MPYLACVQLIEINAHSLFSKWFSESGKLVMKLFEQIQELVEDSDTFVCVMIDEVESLSAARKSSMGGSEPSDAIRVVNALLTQIDKLSRFPNVLVLTTSNITGALLRFLCLSCARCATYRQVFVFHPSRPHQFDANSLSASFCFGLWGGGALEKRCH